MFKKIQKEYERWVKKQIKKIDKYNNLFIGEGYYKKSYSQSAEDMVLDNYFECFDDSKDKEYKGFYIDIGAHHPFSGSNTQVFYEKGYRGINIDATPNSMKLFELHRPNDINLELAIAEKNDILKFNMYNIPVLNCFEGELSKKYEKSIDVELLEQIEVKTFTLEQILNKYLPKNQHIDFMNVDIEGVDLEVLKTNNWEKYIPDYIMIEHIHDGYDIENIAHNPKYLFLKEKGYNIISITPLTLILKLEK